MKRDDRDYGNFFARLGRIALGLGAFVSGGMVSVKLAQQSSEADGERNGVRSVPDPPTYETRDMNPHAVVRIAIGFVVALGMVALLVTVLQYWWMGYVVAPVAVPPSLNPPANVTLPAEPRFETEPGTALDRIQARDEERLTTYGWVNQSAGTVHIPIDRAMQLLIQRGLPVAPQDASNSFDTAGNELPSSSSSGRVLEPVAP